MNLPRRQKQLYDLLLGRGDVLISQLYEHMTYQQDVSERTVADMQRRLSPYISLLNRSLAGEGLKVEPGALKNTYRLVKA